ncbi:unnamed protein product [Echinostoma caproni]|uniref:Uncharacterized protein n=1 Tax=Echinostoma caproni TaxID=27848 RepID=A0A183AE16_9TREM|nr:unnamed protein product [Echinostoma caproni]
MGPCTASKAAQLETVQRAATRFVEGLRGISYEGRLSATELFPMSYRRLGGDLIYTRRIIRGDFGPELQLESTLKNNNRIKEHALTLRKMQSMQSAADLSSVEEGDKSLECSSGGCGGRAKRQHFRAKTRQAHEGALVWYQHLISPVEHIEMPLTIGD